MTGRAGGSALAARMAYRWGFAVGTGTLARLYEVLYASYTDLMKDPAAAVEAVNRFLGGALDGDAMRKTVDPSLYRQRC